MITEFEVRLKKCNEFLNFIANHCELFNYYGLNVQYIRYWNEKLRFYNRRTNKEYLLNEIHYPDFKHQEVEILAFCYNYVLYNTKIDVESVIYNFDGQCSPDSVSRIISFGSDLGIIKDAFEVEFCDVDRGFFYVENAPSGYYGDKTRIYHTNKLSIKLFRQGGVVDFFIKGMLFLIEDMKTLSNALAHAINTAEVWKHDVETLKNDEEFTQLKEKINLLSPELREQLKKEI